MDDGNMIVGQVVMNPIANKLTPCIKILLSEGLSDGDLVLLEVKNHKFIRELAPSNYKTGGS